MTSYRAKTPMLLQISFRSRSSKSKGLLCVPPLTLALSPTMKWMNHLTIVMTVEWLYLTLDVTAGRGADDAGGSSKRRGHGNHSPEKSSSRSPLRNATLDSNVRKNNVEFREPLASFRYRPKVSSTSLINRRVGLRSSHQSASPEHVVVGVVCCVWMQMDKTFLVL